MTNEVSRKLRAPAIALIVTGIISEVLGIMVSLSGILRLFIETGTPPPPDGPERMGYIIASVVLYGIGVLSIFVSPLIIYGGIQMMNGRKYVSAKFAALLSMIPLTSCFFTVTMPIGAWALITLSRPDVRVAFASPSSSPETMPPTDES